MSKLGIVIIQMASGTDRDANISSACRQIREAARKYPGARLHCLPECFNSPYGNRHFAVYAEAIPAGRTSQALAALARELNIFILGGSIPERSADGSLYNSSAVFGPTGQLVALHRKVHLYDIDLRAPLYAEPQGPHSFEESAALSGGDQLTTFRVDGLLVGLGICFDIYFDEYARAARQRGCDVLIYPSAFNDWVGPLHWELLNRARAADNQVYAINVSPARVEGAEYVAWGHSLVSDPWGRVVMEAGAGEETMFAEIDCAKIAEFRKQIPLWRKRRPDVYAQWSLPEKK